MIGRLVWASVRQRAGRSALLLGGYALGVGVTIVLLSVGQAMVDQARDKDLLGGGDLIVLPEGIDLETLRTGGASSMYFDIEQAPLLYREVLAGSRFRDRIAAAAPWIDDELVYLETDTALIPLSAGATIPDLAAELAAAPDLVDGSWADLDADHNWRDPTPAEFYRSLDAMHLPGRASVQDTTWAEWHYFNILLPDAGWLYLSYMVVGDVPDGRWSGRVLATRVAPESEEERAYSVTVDPEHVTFAEGHPDLTVGASSMSLRPDGTYRLRANVPAEFGGPRLTVDLAVYERTRRYLPPVEIGNRDFVSGYTVPLLDGRATGRICEGTHCHQLEDARAYHDHNWGTWSMVTWDWGQASAGSYSVLYGGVARGDEAARTETESDENAAVTAPTANQGGRFLYLADENGFAGVFTIREITTRWADDGGPEDPGRSPEAIVVEAVNGRDTLTLRVTVGHTRVTSVPVPGSDAGALFYQMRGSLDLTGRIGGTEVSESGTGFFETWTRGRQ